MSNLFTENKWYLVSPPISGNWETVKQEWFNNGISAAQDATFHNIIYKLKEPVSQGTTLNNASWEPLDITDSSLILLPNIGYFIYVTVGGTPPTENKYLALKYTIKTPPGTPFGAEPESNGKNYQSNGEDTFLNTWQNNGIETVNNTFTQFQYYPETNICTLILVIDKEDYNTTFGNDSDFNDIKTVSALYSKLKGGQGVKSLKIKYFIFDFGFETATSEISYSKNDYFDDPGIFYPEDATGGAIIYNNDPLLPGINGIRNLKKVTSYFNDIGVLKADQTEGTTNKFTFSLSIKDDNNWISLVLNKLPGDTWNFHCKLREKDMCFILNTNRIIEDENNDLQNTGWDSTNSFVLDENLFYFTNDQMRSIIQTNVEDGTTLYNIDNGSSQDNPGETVVTFSIIPFELF